MKAEERLKLWKADNTELLPDFIIGGAMKSGTTSLKYLLNRHPDIYIPKAELNFFDIDDILQHPDFAILDKSSGEWQNKDVLGNQDVYWKWYQNHFKGFSEITRGEDSTTYLYSSLAAQRIYSQKKRIKLIFVLRQPSERAFSNYNHLLRTGRVTLSFAKTIQKSPHLVLNRSLYKRHLRYYYDLFPSSRIKIVLFEELFNKTSEVINDIFRFLELDSKKIEHPDISIHRNKSTRPKSKRVQLMINTLFGNQRIAYYHNFLPDKTMMKREPWYGKIAKTLTRLNYQSNQKSSKISPADKRYLDSFFEKELQGLDELVNKDVLSKWF